MSEELITITPQKPPYTSMDFAALREAGVNHIQDLAGKIWTDYNLHDPGITTLEILCYAITDLGYRTNLPVKDLMTSQEANPRSGIDRKSTRLNSSHQNNSYAVFCLKKKKIGTILKNQCSAC